MASMLGLLRALCAIALVAEAAAVSAGQDSESHDVGSGADNGNGNGLPVDIFKGLFKGVGGRHHEYTYDPVTHGIVEVFPKIHHPPPEGWQEFKAEPANVTESYEKELATPTNPQGSRVNVKLNSELQESLLQTAASGNNLRH
mmetsp:Transcript_57522/g.136846  ORF Transcript_57522/g.136846 Transcript_57522/m.136846 type:complete len:143 (+) Transcript_57522:129-557(+)|eukprot:CAMPEP_0178452062 /NCGR_PEP_ID=MMETSP0689_2-20121128/44032_1 /TAXON_ID=160604 /ORGANISM="Amphidinium massartii, Strain CS-259" /LENGTH=142 /DNA_ID=CAMNT_0020077719 /DNA_START=129 /DNA_END=557 /DNA_ORIENTATION=-